MPWWQIRPPHLKGRPSTMHTWAIIPTTFWENWSRRPLKKKRSGCNRKEYRLIQISDPIFRLPEPDHKFDYRSHFFAPKKYFAGKYVDTYTFNLGVIWAMSLFLFLTLYTELFLVLGKLFGKIAGWMIPGPKKPF